MKNKENKRLIERVDDVKCLHEPYCEFYLNRNEPKYSMKHAVIATIVLAFIMSLVMSGFISLIYLAYVD